MYTIWNASVVPNAKKLSVPGRQIRILTIVDIFTRESLALNVGQNIKDYDVLAVLDKLLKKRGRPKRIQVDNGSEFISKTTAQ